MARYAYDRLSAQDASFLWAEAPNNPMHIGGVAILDAKPLQRGDGSIDIDRYRDHVRSVLHWIPRYRQKLAWTPVEGWPVWIDDRQFDLGYHIRHIALPRPGTIEQLKELIARIYARALDRSHPLWEIWVIEGVENGDQFAVLNKIHHCMIDGAAGADLSQILLSPSPRVEDPEEVPYMPRPVPTRTELLRDSIALGVSRPIGLLKSFARGAQATSEEGGAQAPPSPGLAPRLRALGDLVQQSLTRASATPLNGELGSHRRIEWMTMPLEDAKDLRKVFDCTINDVVLATVTEAVRRYLFRRRVDVRHIDFRVAAPVSTRRPDHDTRHGNHVSTWVVPLPLVLEDPVSQIEAVRDFTRELKDSEAALAMETVMELAEWLPAPLISSGLASLQTARPVNMIVTNVPGPQFPLYTVGSKLQALYPLVPLMPGGGLTVALFSYEGKLCWGFNSDYELVPDLRSFVDDVRVAFERLRHAAVTRFIERRTAEPEPPPPELREVPADPTNGRVAEPEPAESGESAPTPSWYLPQDALEAG
jgi:WS/DGAT/MGAT family acyltransferase